MAANLRSTSFVRNLQRLLKPRGRDAFLMTVVPNGKLLDVGCGNDSAARLKALRPDIHYTGLDVGDYYQSEGALVAADAYIVTPPERFAEAIQRLPHRMDAAVSSHNLEHCDDPNAVLIAMARRLKAGGRLYLAFPCEESVRFPRGRRGCLNFHDDPQHKEPPIFAAVCASLEASGMRILYARRRYRPPVLWLVGLLLEPLSALIKRVIPAGATWALYGFESIIWAE